MNLELVGTSYILASQILIIFTQHHIEIATYPPNKFSVLKITNLRRDRLLGLKGYSIDMLLILFVLINFESLGSV